MLKQSSLSWTQSIGISLLFVLTMVLIAGLVNGCSLDQMQNQLGLDDQQINEVQKIVKDEIAEKMEDTSWPGWGPLIGLLAATGLISYPIGRTARKTLINNNA